MENSSLAESIITAVVMVLVFGSVNLPSVTAEPAELQSGASGMALSVGPVSLVVQVDASEDAAQ